MSITMSNLGFSDQHSIIFTVSDHLRTTNFCQFTLHLIFSSEIPKLLSPAAQKLLRQQSRTPLLKVSGFYFTPNYQNI